MQYVFYYDDPQEYEMMREQIRSQTLRDLYSKIELIRIKCIHSSEKSKITCKYNRGIFNDENHIYYSLISEKLITYNFNNQNKYDSQQSSQFTDIVICCQRFCLIIEEINITFINQIIEKLQNNGSTLIHTNINLEKEEEEMTVGNKDIYAFCSHFKEEILINYLLLKTITPVIGFKIQRFFYPSYFFRGFFLFDQRKKCEKRIKNHLRKCLVEYVDDGLNFDFNLFNLRESIHENKNKFIPKSEILEFHENDFIVLRMVKSNEFYSFYLVLHVKKFYLFMMKKLNKSKIIPNEMKREIFFCQNYSHRCLVQFYGFLIDNGQIIGFIYEYMCNGSLNSYVIDNHDKINKMFSLMTIYRISKGIEYLISNSLIHRDLKPENILLDNDFIPYISDFETIRQIDDNEKYTGDIGSTLYSSPEQDRGDKLSYSTDIYSFGMIIYFLFEKNNMRLLNDSNIYLKSENDKILPITNCSNNLQHIYVKCINYHPINRPGIDQIVSTIKEEIDSFSSCELYSISEKDYFNLSEAIQFIYENILIQDRNEGLLKCFENIFHFQLLLISKANKDKSNHLLSVGDTYFNGNFANKDHNKAKQYYELAAQLNNFNAYLNLGVLYKYGNYIKQDYLKAKEYLEKAAKSNNSIALINLAELYYKGLGVKKDFSLAFKYFDLAAKQGNHIALLNLGNLYFNGFGVKQDFSMAKKLYELSSQQGNSSALLNLGNLYAKGQGVSVDFKKVRYYYELSAHKCNPKAFLNLAKIYYEGLGIQKNYDKVKECLENAGKFNESDGFLTLGNMFMSGDGLKKDYSQGKKYFELAAKQNNVNALSSLGTIFLFGYGVKIDYLQAKYYYELAAAQNDSFSLLQLGDIYRNGLNVEINYLKAKEYYELSAKSNNSNAFLRLGILYSKGLGVEKDYSKAKHYFESSARFGNSNSLMKLGDLYRYGHGVKKNYRLAKSFYEYAAKKGNPYALFYMGVIYSIDDVFDVDYQKAIHYFNECIKVEKFNIHSNDSKSFDLKYNKYRYRAYNEIGLIYLTYYKDQSKAIDFIKEAAFSEFPFGQNNFGLFNQFYLKNEEKAEYMFNRASEHHFALAEYNLGYLKEKFGKIDESIEFYTKASNDEDKPLEFHNHNHYDKKLEISKTFIICYTNLKLTEYYLSIGNFEKEACEFFIKSFKKLHINDENSSYHFYLEVNADSLQNIFLYLKSYILNFPPFNLMNQANIILEKTKVKSSFPIEKIELNRNLEKELIISNNQKDLNEINKRKMLIFENPGEIFNYCIKNIYLKNMLHDEIKDILKTMHSILYAPPYLILFGRIKLKKNEPNELVNRKAKNINELFYEGLGII